jgi:hypothetical protein
MSVNGSEPQFHEDLETSLPYKLEEDLALSKSGSFSRYEAQKNPSAYDVLADILEDSQLA